MKGVRRMPGDVRSPYTGNGRRDCDRDVHLVLAGDKRSIARAISLIERQVPPSAAPGCTASRRPAVVRCSVSASSPSAPSRRQRAEARTLLDALYPHTGRAHIVGITGAPGTGKSTLVSQIACTYRREYGLRVGILAVDPTSPFSGGALLGDRIRMGDLAGDPGIFIRSMATRGAIGGLSRSTFYAAQILDAAGYEIILIETVGTGQDEVEIAHTAHTTVVVQAPGLGDDIQALKAGMIEIADILVVNKADRDGAEAVTHALQFMLDSGTGPAAARPDKTAGRVSSPWQVPICKTIALDGTGIAGLISQINAHHDYLKSSGALHTKELQRAQAGLEDLLRQMLLERFLSHLQPEDWESTITRIATRQLSLYEALEQLLPDKHPSPRT